MDNAFSTKPGLLEQNKKQKDIENDMEEVIQHNFLDNKNIFYDKKDYLKGKLIFSIITFAILISLKFMLLQFFTQISIIRVILVLLEAPFIFIFFYVVFTLLTLLLSKKANWRIQFKLLKYNSIFLTLCISFGINCYYLLWSDSFDKIFQLIFDISIENETKYTEIYFWTQKCCILLYPALVLFTMRKLTLEYLNYRIHYKFHKKRILENDKLTASMHQLNEYTHQETAIDDITKWSSHIFSCLTKEQKDTLKIEDFILIFKEKEGKSLFELFDINRNNEIDKEEFIKIYQNIFSERKALKDSLEEVSNSINKLGTLITVSYVVLILSFIFLFVVGNLKEVSVFLYILFIAGIYISSKTITELLNSLLFIFIIRPYDIGDKLEIKNSLYTVKKIGLLYTDLENNGEIMTQSNDSLRKLEIKNFRNIEFIIYAIKRKIQTKHLKLLSEYKKKIRGFLLENTNKFKPEFELTNLEILEKSATFDIIIRVIVQFQELASSKKRRDEMVILLHRIEELLFKD